MQKIAKENKSKTQKFQVFSVKNASKRRKYGCKREKKLKKIFFIRKKK